MFCLIYWFLTFLFKLFIYFYPKNNLEQVAHVERKNVKAQDIYSQLLF